MFVALHRTHSSLRASMKTTNGSGNGDVPHSKEETGGVRMPDRSKEKVAKLLGRRTQSVCEAEKEIAEGKKIIQSVDKLSKFFGESTEAIPLTFGGKSGECGDSPAAEGPPDPFSYVSRLLDAGNFATVHAALSESAIITKNHSFTSHLPSTQSAFGVACILWEIAGIKNDLDIIISSLLYTSVNTNKAELLAEVEERFGHTVAETITEVQRFVGLSREGSAMAYVRQAPPASKTVRLLLLADLFYRVSYVFKHPPSIPIWTVYGMDRTLEALKGYFCWAERVFRSLAGTNDALDTAFLAIIKGKFRYGDWEGAVMAEPDLQEAYIEKYYIFLRFIDEISPSEPLERKQGEK